VAKRGLDEVDRAASLQRVAGVGVAKPMGRHRNVDAGASTSEADYAEHLGFV